MVDYLYSQILGQQVSFVAAADTVRFDLSNAASTIFETDGVALRTTANNNLNQVVVFDATPLLESTSIGLFTPTNTSFFDGSVLAVGDLTGDDTLDGGDNVIDFVSNPLLAAALNNNNQAHGLGGNDTITLTNSSGNQRLLGGDGDDSITAGNGNNTIFGGNSFADSADGGDTIIVGSGSNTIYGNAGNDVVTFAQGTFDGNQVSFFGGLGDDSITNAGTGGTFEIFGGPGGDSITITNNGNLHTIYGGDGDDSINLAGSSAAMDIFGGDDFADSDDGSDSITLGGGSARLFANAGADSVLGAVNTGQTATLYLGVGSDVFTSQASTGNYVIYAGPDGDTIDLTNHLGNSTIFGGIGIADPDDGGDTIVGSSGGSDLIYANAGSDVITVNPGDNQSATVFAGAGNDTIAANAVSTAAAFELYGNTDNDTFQLNFNAAQPIMRVKDFSTGENNLEITLSGGSGAASLSLDRSNNQTILRKSGAETIALEDYTGNLTDQNTAFSDGSVFITNFGEDAASLTGTDNNDQLFAGDNGDTLIAGGGDDVLTGGAGLDTFSFLTANFNANDTLNGGDSFDVLTLGTPGTNITDEMFVNKTSIDTLVIESGDFSTNGITLGGNATRASIGLVDGTAAGSFNLDVVNMTNVLAVRGSGGDDIVNGTNFNDILLMGAGNDTITGNRGRDVIDGGDGNDVMVYTIGGLDGTDNLRDMDLGTSTTFVDRLQFDSSPTAFNLGNNDNIVDGAIINSVENAGAADSEIIIIRDVGIATNEVTQRLDIVNFNVSSNNGVLNMFYDTTLNHVVLYYDINSAVGGGHIHIASFTNLTSLTDMNNVDFTDFIFI